VFDCTPDLGDWLDELNPEQRAAATAPPDVPLLVLAGAGTGKTLTLSSRVAWLVKQGIPAERILLLTFTRRAARTMVARTRTLLEGASVARVAVLGGTFHSVAWRLVRLYADPLGLPARLSVLDSADSADLLDLVRHDLGYADSGRRFPRKATLADIYSRTVNAQLPLSETLAAQFPWCAPYADEIAAIFKSYGKRKRRSHLLDLDDLLLYLRALATHEQAGPRVAGLFDHVLVDEYQDVNLLQVEIVQALCSRHRGLTVVGDDLQAIYGWRAASAEHILEFARRFPDAASVTLERNYRSTQPILDVANAVARQAERRHPKRLRSVRGDGPRPELLICRDEGEETLCVVDRILADHERGVDLREQAVLMRTAHHSRVLELELARRRIPFVKYGGIRYVEAAHVKDFVALARIAVNPADEVSWFRILQLLDGVGPRSARRIVDTIGAATGPDLVARWESLDVIGDDVRARGDPVVRAIASAEAVTAPHEQARLLLRGLEPLLRGRYPDAEARLDDLGLILGQAAAAPNLEQLVNDLVLDPPSSSADFAGPPHLEEDYLVLSTIHSAKGLEWDAVHLIHATDGNLPSDMALASRDGLDEERRLFYVALTRARRSLHVYAPVRFFHHPAGDDDANGIGKLSRFLTSDVCELCTVSQHAEPEPSLVGAEIHEQVTLAIDGLWS
jgi:DNA helicase-2/ATP-dependent DNA helicase PcrA